jgi:hypothetical protein
MKGYFVIFLSLFGAYALHSQVEIYRNKDSVSLSIGAYADVYYGYDFNEPADKERPYAISSGRHDEIALNIAIVKIHFQSPNARLVISPAFGTMMQKNYAQEPALLRNLFEGYLGFRPFKKRLLWLDAGVFVSPYTNEGNISMEQFTYTRSNACENTPYFLSGLRAGFPVSPKLNATLYLVNGWQVIQTSNALQSFGSWLEYKANNKLSLNWTTFIGDARSEGRKDLATRYYSDASALWNAQGKTSLTVCGGYGVQETYPKISRDSARVAQPFSHFALQLRHKFLKKHALAIRADYFNDAGRSLVYSVLTDSTVKNLNGIVISSITANYTLAISEQVMFRLEWRGQYGKQEIYFNKQLVPTRTSNLIIGSLAVKF